MSDLETRISALSADRRRLLDLLRRDQAPSPELPAPEPAPPSAPAPAADRPATSPFSMIGEEDRRRLPAGVEDAYPLTMVQLGMLYHMERTPDAPTPAYHNVNSFHVRAPLDLAAFEEAVERVVMRHPILRTAFDLTSYSEPLQLVHRSAYLPVEAVDLRHLDAAAQEAMLDRFIREENRRLVDLSRPPLVRFHVHRRSDDRFQFTLTEPHAISDGWSTMSTLAEIFELYTALARGDAPAPAPPGGSGYRDFVFLERQALASPAARDFWTRRLAGFRLDRLPRWPRLRETAAGPPAAAGETKPTGSLPPAVVEDLERLARLADVPFKTVLLAAHVKVMAALTGRDQVTTGLTTHGRPEEEGGERARGLFLNTLPLRVELPAGSWLDLLRAVFAEELELLPHRRYPLAALQRLAGGQVLFESVFSYLHFHVMDRLVRQGGGLELQPAGHSDLSVTHFPLAATFTRMPAARSQLLLTLERNDPSLPPAQVQAIFAYYRRALAALAADPAAPHDAGLLLSAAERHQALVEWNGGQPAASWGAAARPGTASGPPPAAASLHERFAAVAARHPRAVAVVAGAERLTYGQLDRLSDRLADRLRAAGVGPEVRVALGLERSTATVVAILGVLKAGGAYVPLDPAYPEARRDFMLRDSGARVMVCERRLAERFAHVAAGPVRLLYLDAADSAPGRSQARSRSRVRSPRAHPENAAYVIYTSGSTGNPKGVVVTHANVMRLFDVTAERFAFGARDVWTLFHSYAFDFSVWEIWGALLFGGRLVVVPYLVSRSPEAFLDLLRAARVTVLSQTPSAFRQLTAAAAAAPEAPAAPAAPGVGGRLALRLVVFGGEALDLQSLAPWFAHHPRRPRLVNMYGITETTVHVTWRQVRAADLAAGPGSLIGGPLPDLELYVLDAHGQPVPLAVPGELHVGGAGLARGYLGRPELTAGRFVPDRWSGRPGSRLYRTGDLARRLPDGDLEYLGRTDSQLKIRGFRIEAGEIEAALAAHPRVKEAVVLARRWTGGDGAAWGAEARPHGHAGAGEARLVAYVLARGNGGGAPLAVAELRSFLQARLPEHAVPSAFVEVAAWPLTPHGKLDRAALPAPDSSRPAVGQDYAAPRDAREAALASAWQQALRIERVGIHDNFFALGGDSIRSIQLVALARERGFELSIQHLFQHPTVAELAAAIGATAPGAAEPAVPPPAAGAVETIAGPPPDEEPATAPFSLVAAADRERLPPGLEDAYPLSRLQAGMLFHRELWADAYHNVESFHLRAPFALAPFAAAVGRVVARHAVLRTSFDLSRYGEPLQLVHSAAELPIVVEDLRRLDAAAQEAAIDRHLARELRRPFDLAVPPQLRFHVHLRGDHDFQFTFTENHAIFDGWSLYSTLTEIFNLYSALLRGETPAAEPPPPVPFRDFIAAERAVLASAAARAFWRERLAGAEPLDLPRWPAPAGRTAPEPVAATARAAAAAGGRRVESVPAVVAPAVLAGLEDAARQAGIPLKSVLLAAHLKVLALLGGRDDVLTGMVTHGRLERAGGEQTRGLFLNTLPYRLRLPPGSWLGLARAAFTAEQELLAWRRFPLAELQQASAGRPLFTTAFNFTHFHVVDEVARSGLVGLLDFRKSTANNFALSVGFTLDPGQRQLRLEIAGDGSELTRPQLLAVTGYLTRALAELAAAPDARHDGWSPLAPAERHQLLAEWNDTAAPRPERQRDGGSLHRLIAAQAARSPEAVAVSCEEGQLTYRELAARAGRLARRLRRWGVGPEVRVGLAAERSLEMVVGMLAILQAGGAYVPLDAGYPDERLAYMIEDSGMPVLLSQRQFGERCERLVKGKVRLVYLPSAAASPQGSIPGKEGTDPVPESAAPAIALESPVSTAVDASWSGSSAWVAEASAAYVMYTSGSTGWPKGVVISHQAILNRLLWMLDELGLGAEDRVLQKTPFSFDVSVPELFGPLLAGACLVMARPGGHQDSAYLAAAIAREGITQVHFVPSMLRVFLEEPELARCASLRRVMASGEALTPALAWRFQQRLGRPLGISLHNLYGPTEAAVEVSHWRSPAEPREVPIGRPIANTRLYLLDRHDDPVPVGVVAELHIGGLNLARGYLGRPELTAEKFVPDRMAGAADGAWEGAAAGASAGAAAGPGSRLYRTGDLARWLPSGEIEFLGRIDDQVKVRGFRIELGEIEATLLRHPAVRAAAARLLRDRAGESRLVAYIVPRHGAPEPEAQELRAFLKQRLPDYMVPSVFVPLAALPLTSSGKVDRKALPVPEMGRPPAAAWRSPGTPLEQLVAGMFEELLALDRASADDDFFELGGHSLLATQLISRLRHACGVELPLAALFEAPTVAGLARRLEAGLAAGPAGAAPPIVPVPRGGDLPLSFGQERLWFLDQLQPGLAVYNIHSALRLAGPLDVPALAAALAAIVARHEILRTSFPAAGGRPRQAIHPPGPVPLPLVDLAALPPSRHEQQAAGLAAAHAARPFDLAAGPLLRVALLRLAAGEHVAQLALHHTIFDGWSIGLLVEEVQAHYAACLAGQPPPRPPLALQYADFAAWQRSWLEGEALDAQLAFWREELRDMPAVLELPADRPRPPVQSFRGSGRDFALPPALSLALRRLARGERATLFMTLLAGFQALIHRYTGRQDVSVGTPIAGRNRLETEPLIGLFINMLVLRSRPAGGLAFGELLRQVRQAALRTYAHQELPFERLVEALQPERSLSFNPLFQVMLLLEDFRQPPPALPGLAIQPMRVRETEVRYTLELAMVDDGKSLGGAMRYHADLFDAATIDRMLAHLQALLAAVADDPRRRLGELPLLAAAERHQLLQEWNDTAVAPDVAPAAATLDALFVARAARAPAALAAVCEGRTLSYGDLDRQANRLAWLLRRLGVGPGTLVAVHLSRGLDMLPALLGILKAGGAYLPVETSLPRERVRWLLAATAAPCVVTQRRHAPLLGGLRPEVPSLAHLVCLDGLAEVPSGGGAAPPVGTTGRPPSPPAQAAAPAVWGAADLASQPATCPAPLAGPDDVAYVIFTSGSTGAPKGVVVRHRPVLNLIRWVNGRFAIAAGDRVLFITALSFDLSVYDVFGLLAAGGSIHVASEAEAGDPERLVELLCREPVTFCDSAPAALARLVPFLRAAGPATRGSRLRLVFLSGDWIPVSLPGDLRGAFPAARVIALGGATEATVWSNFFPVGEVDPLWASIPYGRPIAGAHYHVLDAGFAPCPIGVPGALYIGGGCLASGYAQAPELTAEKFVPDPFAGVPGAVLYKTGDLARYRPDGNLEFLGRSDFQVKIRGFRIELGEIEAALAQHDAVRASVVAAREDRPGERRLVAYVVAREGREAAAGELRAHLQARLPDYMVPAAFVAMPALPLTANGKVDRARLPAPGPARPALLTAFAPARTPREKLLAEVWSEVLGSERVGIHDNFFELGGDSILSIQVIARCAQAGLQLTARQMFQYQTVAELASIAETGPAIVAEQGPVTGPVALTAVQRWFFEQDLPDRHHWNQSVLLEVRQPLPAALLERALAALLAHHDALRLGFTRDESGVGGGGGGEWRQAIAAPRSPHGRSTRLDLAALPLAARPAAAERAAAALQASLDLAAGGPVRAALFELGPGHDQRLLIIVHHLAIDGVSWRILVEDLETACRQLARGEAVALPPKTTSFQHWAERVQRHAGSAAVAAELPIWAAADRRRVARLPLDEPEAGNPVGAARQISLRLSAADTRALLQEVPPVYRTQINEVLLTALAEAFARWTGSRLLQLDMEGHGREEFADDLDVSRTVGWFTSIYPLLLDLGEVHGYGPVLKAVKEQVRAVPNRGLGYGLLRYLAGRSEGADAGAAGGPGDGATDGAAGGPGDPAELLRSLPASQVSFNYLGQLDQVLPAATRFTLARESGGPNMSPRQPRRYLLEVSASVMGGSLELAITYGSRVHSRATMERLAEAWRGALLAIVEHCRNPGAGGFTPADFPLAALDQAALDRLFAAQREVEDLYPLSPLQEGMLYHALDAPGSGVYVQQVTCDLHGDLDLDAFRRAWERVAERHTVLRTAFAWRDLPAPMQLVRPRVPVAIACLDWGDVPAAERAARLHDWLEEDRRRGLQLTEAPVMRLTLVRGGPRLHHFVWTYHHLLLDGWSLPAVLDEVLAFFRAFSGGEDLDLPRPRPFRDYIGWLSRQDQAAAAGFWRGRLRGFRTPTPLALGPEQPPSAGGAGGDGGDGGRHVRQIELPEAATASLEAFARGQQVTLSTVLQGAAALLLARGSGEREVLFGATVAGRPAELPGVESMIGMFINTLPVRIEVPPAAELAPWLRTLQAEQAELRGFEFSPLVDIQGWSEIPRGLRLFDLLVVFENFPVRETPPEPGGGLGVTNYAVQEQVSYPLMLEASDGRRMVLRATADGAAGNRFSPDAVDRWVWHLTNLLADMAAAPGKRLDELSPLSAAERAQLVREWAAGLAAGLALAAPPLAALLPAALHQLLEPVLARQPDAIAVEMGGELLSYGELARRAGSLAGQLRRRGIGCDAVVGICLERSLHQMVAVLAALTAGAAYLPLDADYPEERLAFMIADAGVRVVLTAEDRLAAAVPERGLPAGVETVRIDALPARADALRARPDAGGTGRPLRHRGGEGADLASASLAYVMYTSGSTGRPKGVAMSHGALVNLAAWQIAGSAAAGLARPRTLQFSSLSFDVSCQEIFATWGAGGALVLVPAAVRRDPAALLALLAERAVERLFLPFAALQQLAEVAAEGGQLPAGLREVLTAGEQLQTTAALVELFRRLPRARLHNQYGPTETHVASAQPLAADPASWPALPPIGRPLPGLRLHLLDVHGQPAALGLPGEISIGGAGLARGYLARPEQTAERFVPDPHGAAFAQPGGRLYRTGDLGRFTAAGEVEYLGRIDQQVKVRGFRIEAGEIEIALTAHPAVREAAVVARAPRGAASSAERRLVAYVVPHPGASPAPAELADFLRRRLPEPMVPGLFVQLAELPLTPSGKVERRSLPDADAATALAASSYVAPRTPVEELVAGIWAEVLGRDRIGIHDSFFSVGGHSLLATRVAARLRGALGIDLPLRLLFESPDLAALAAAVESELRAAAGAPAPPLARVPRDRRLPLSFAQQRLWFLEQLDPGSPAYNTPAPVVVEGRLDYAVLRRSLDEVARRQEALRTGFASVDGVPEQRLAPPRPGLLPLPVVDLAALPPPSREAAARALARWEARLPFDLAVPPLARTTLLRLAPERHLFLLTIHHIVSDGWSIAVMLSEVLALSSALAQGRGPEAAGLPELTIQYADYAVWQRGWLAGEALDRQLAYWREQLKGAPPASELPADRPRPAMPTYRGARLLQRLPAALSDAVRALARRQGATLFMTLEAGLALLLHRHSQQQDLVLGTSIAGRTRVELEPLVGFFVNTLALRSDLSGDPDGATLLARARETALGAYAHQDLPFEQLVDEIEPRRDLSRNPLFQVFFVLQTVPAPRPAPGSALTIHSIEAGEGVSKFDLTLAVHDEGPELALTWEHSTDLFDAATIRRLQEHLAALLGGLAARPERPVGELPLLGAAQRAQLLWEWNQPVAAAAAAAAPLPLHRLFEAQAARRPLATAVVHDVDALTYGELNGRANRLARRLRGMGVGPGSRVGLCVERSLDMVVGLLAILKAGGAYLPLDPTYPPERLAFMLADAGAALVLAQERLRGRLPASAAIPVLLVNGGPGDEDTANLPGGAGPDDAAYVIYTSGSTGVPKGVEVTHANVARLFAATREWFDFGPDDVWTLFHSYAFDFSVWEIWGALLAGGQLVVVPYEVSRAPEAFLTLLATERVTVLNQTPSAFRQLAQAAGAGGAAPELALRWVIFGGEALDPRLLGPWIARYGDAAPRLVNMYGITETTVHVTYARLRAADLAAAGGGSVIGRPIPDLSVHLLDRRLHLLPPGAPGEIYVGGAGVARGYLGRPELTAERFLPDPWSALPGSRLYRTGDLARRLPDGGLEYLGRIDSQVKIRGFRIELGEIEAALDSHPAVAAALVEARRDPAGPAVGAPAEQRLVAYLVAAAQPAPTISELRAWIARSLPDHMLPAAFVFLAALPLTPSGKVDRRALPAPERARPELAAAFAAPRTPAEELLAALWREALGLAHVGVEDNFFALGGHSLLAIQVLDRLREAAAVALPLRSLFEAPTVAGLAAELERRWVDPAAAAVLPALPRVTPDPDHRHEPFPLTDLQQAYWIGSTGAYELGDVSPHSYMEIELGELDLARLGRAWRRLVAHHDALRLQLLPDGRQRILPEAPAYRIGVLDLRGLPAAAVEAAIEPLRRRMSEQGPALDRWPLFEIRATRLAGAVRLHISLSLLICDARSTSLLGRDLTRLYFMPESEWPGLPAPALSPRDYVLALAAIEESEPFARALAYWRDRLPALPPGPELPLARPPASLGRARLARHEWRLPPADWRRLRERAAAARCTPTAVLAAAYAEVLAAWSRHPRFTLDLLYFNRLPLHPGVAEMVANLSSTLLLEVDAAGGAFAQRALALQAQLWRDLDHALVSGVRVLRELTRRQGGGSRFAAPVVFASTLDLTARDQGEAPAVGGQRQVHSSLQTPQVWLDGQVYELDGALALCWFAVEELFPEGLIAGMFAAWCRLVERLAREEAAWLEPARSLAPAPELALRARINDTAAPLAAGLLHGPVLAQAAARPGAVAVTAGAAGTGAGGDGARERVTLTYGELAARAETLAGRLRQLGAMPDTLVGVVAEKGWEQVVSVLAVLQAGAAYLPADPGLPAERLAYMLENGGVRLVLTQAALDRSLEWPPGVRRIAVDEAPAGEPGEASGSAGALGAARAEVSAVEAGCSPDHLAYLIFTSGSTGQPKGVMIDHRAAANTVADMNQRFGVGPDDRVLALSALSFDLSVYDVFGLLAAGGAVVLPPPAAMREPAAWLALAASERVTVWNSVPALMEMLVDHLEARGERLPPSLRLVLLSGDWIPVTLPDRIRALAGGPPGPAAAGAGSAGARPGAGGIEVVSLGGATEAAIWSILHPAAAVDPSWPSIPYGKPMANQSWQVLDAALVPRPAWVPGPLYIGGAGLARGYWRDPAKTAGAFVPDPEGSGGRLYRTGDVGRYRPGGTLELLGREDLQVKVQGYRIELGEIEAALATHPAVRACAVIVQGSRHANKRLIAYVVTTGTAGAEVLAAYLASRLPQYMVPSSFVELAELPLTANGKVDRRALAELRGSAPAVAADHLPPRDELELALAGLWQELLGVSPVSVRANFFELGGHSLAAVRLLARIRAGWGRDLPLATLFAAPTIEELAALLRRDEAAAAPRGPLVAIQPRGPRRPFFCVHPVGGNVLCYAELARRLGPDQPFYGLQATTPAAAAAAAPPEAAAAPPSLEQLAAAYLDEVRHVQPSGPYLLGGWSMGGVVAYEMARQLELAGEEVGLVALIDAGAPGDGVAGAAGDTGGIDGATLAAWFARDLGGQAGREVAIRAEELRPLGREDRLHLLWQRARQAQVLPPDVAAAELDRHLDLFARNWQALLAYVPGPYRGRLDLLPAGDGDGGHGGPDAQAGAVRQSGAAGQAGDGGRQDPVAAWTALAAGGAAVHRLPGDHYSILRPPHLAELAAALDACLSRAATAGAGAPSHPSSGERA
jgi:amino acid adenylation domain-containing protein/non-ribosomal peptide synthase protein (TIGR01720 family)